MVVLVGGASQLKGLGNKALQAGDYDEAIKYYTQVGILMGAG